MAHSIASSQAPTPATPSIKNLRVLVYSDDSTVRSAVATALGRRIAPDLAPHTLFEVATGPALMASLDLAAKEELAGKAGFDLLILDGEAVPEGGMGLARQIKDEIFHAAPILLLIGRPEDAWLATWSRAEAYISHPIDPFNLARAAHALLTQ